MTEVAFGPGDVRAPRRCECAGGRGIRTGGGLECTACTTPQADRTALPAPALLFVLLFTAYPLIQMIWMSFTNWSLITPPKDIGLNNFIRGVDDEQFWGSLGYTFKYTLFITPILMVGGYLLALLVAPNTRAPADHPGDHLRARRHRARRVEPAVVLAVRPDLRAHQPGAAWTSGSSTQPIIWLGMDADRPTWAIIVSVSWKVHRLRHDPVRRRDPGHPATRSMRRRWSTAPASGSGPAG